MSAILPYDHFLKEAVDDVSPFTKLKGEKKKLRLFLSPNFTKLLHNIVATGDFQCKEIANYVLNTSAKSDAYFEFSFIDIIKDNQDFISFLPAQRAWREMDWNTQEEADVEPSGNSPLWTLKGRQENRIGAFITKISDDSFSQIALNKFIAKFKSEILSLSVYNRFELVTGEKIKYWYAVSQYYKDPSGNRDGGLPGSCMRYDGVTEDRGRNCQPYLEMYADNPDKCALLILTNSENKLIGRALVWKGLRKPHDDNKKATLWFMDRIYTIKQSDQELFKKYAKNQGWLYKYEQSAHDDSYMIGDKRITNKSMAIQIKIKNYNAYPFMDTLRYFNPSTGRLGTTPGNSVILIDEKGKQTQTTKMILNATNGTSTRV